MTAPKSQPHDERHIAAGKLLGITPEQAAVQCALIGPDMIYVWAQPRGAAVLVNNALRAQKFEPGVLLQVALSSFDAQRQVA